MCAPQTGLPSTAIHFCCFSLLLTTSIFSWLCIPLLAIRKVDEDEDFDGFGESKSEDFIWQPCARISTLFLDKSSQEIHDNSM